MRSGLSDGGRVVAERLVTWRRPVETEPAGRECADPGCSTLLSIYNSSDRCALHRRFVTIIPRSTSAMAGVGADRPEGDRASARGRAGG
jgi:hypothetical protein